MPDAIKMVIGLEHRACMKSLRNMALFSLEKRQLWTDLVLPSESRFHGRMRHNSHNLKQGSFQLDMGSLFFSPTTTQAVEPLSLEVSEGPCGQSPNQTALNWVQEVDTHNTTYSSAVSHYSCQ